MKSIKFEFYIGFIIISIHALLYFYGAKVINIDHYWQLIDPLLLKEDMVNSLLYFHSNAPLLSWMFWFIESVLDVDKYKFLNILLPFFHVINYLFFSASLKYARFPKKFRQLASGIIFLNPLMFIYFLYPFYSSFIFTSFVFLIFIMYKPMSNEKRLLLLTIIFSLDILLRSSFSIIIMFAFLIPFMKKVKIKFLIFSAFIFLIPFLFNIKNYILFDHFSTSSWLGMNLSNHIPKGDNSNDIAIVQSFSTLEAYKQSKKWPFIKERSKAYNFDHPILQGKNFNNFHYVAISQLYQEELIQKYKFSHSLIYLFKGFFQFYESPADYQGFLDSVSNRFLIKDIFDLPNIKIGNKTLELSWYLFFYPTMLLYYIKNYRMSSFNEKYLLIMVLVFSCLYISIDNAESMRMRFEIEPMYWFLLLLLVKRFISTEETTITSEYI